MAKLFQGKDGKSEEMAEAKALKGGKISKAQYMQGGKSEGHSMKGAGKKADAIKAGKMTPAQYAAGEKREKMADGGMAGCVYRSPQDYRK